MSEWYILDEDNKPVISKVLSAAGWLEKNPDRRKVALDKMPGDVRVSTVFLGLDHGFLASEDPILFETMIFGGPEDGYQERYKTWKEAEEGHKRALELVNPKGE